MGTAPDRVPYTAETTRHPDNSTNLLVILAFSGGGTRASALAFGVLEELRDTRVHWEGRERRLLDEVDIVTGVSGGAFVAAYYCLAGDAMFNDFERRFLKRNVQGALLGRVLNPFNWLRTCSPHFGRSDMAAEYYDKILFKGATYETLARQGRGPFLLIIGTDLTLGTTFTFTPRQFELIGSDLSSVPLSRAAAASSAVPAVFTPITLKNYAGQWPVPASRTNVLTGKMEPNPYADTNHQRFIHVVDGGVSDNLGIRPLLRDVQERGYPFSTSTPQSPPTKVLFVVVNAETKEPRNWAQREAPPGVFLQLLGFSSSVMSAYSADTLLYFGSLIREWAEESRRRQIQINFYPVEVGFGDVANEAERDYLNRIPTAFHLSDDCVDRLRAAGRALLRQSPQFRRLMEEIEARPPE
jgi:NTE family protein